MQHEAINPVNKKLQDISMRIRRKPLRRAYLVRFVIRCILLVFSFIVYFVSPAKLNVVISRKWSDFFSSFTFAHVIWIIWMFDMLAQLIPLRKHIPIGSQKNFLLHFRPVLGSISRKRIIQHIKDLTAAAYKVFALWAAMIAVIGLLYFFGPLEEIHMFLFAALFYVCDLICVLFWCPFRVLIMKNKCCTTCRIFNWDHLMMFSPFIFLRSLYAWSLVAMAIIIWALWELSVFFFPERFSLYSNKALKCSECTDRLCSKPRGDKSEAGYQ